MLIADEFAATDVQNQISVDTTFKVCKWSVLQSGILHS